MKYELCRLCIFYNVIYNLKMFSVSIIAYNYSFSKFKCTNCIVRIKLAYLLPCNIGMTVYDTSYMHARSQGDFECLTLPPKFFPAFTPAYMTLLEKYIGPKLLCKIVYYFKGRGNSNYI
jgi:hypothetical protein